VNLPSGYTELSFKNTLVALFGIFLLGVCVSFSSCASHAPRLNWDYLRHHPEEFLQMIRGQIQSIQTLEGTAHITIETFRESYNGRAHIYFRAPDSLLIRIQATLGIHAATILLDKDSIRIWVPRERMLYVGSVKEANLEPYWGIQLEVRKIRSFVTGYPYMLLEGSGDSAAMDWYNERVVVRTGQGRYVHWLAVDPQKGTILAWVFQDEKSGLTLRQENKFLRKHRGIWLPRFIQLTYPDTKERLSLYYERLRINRRIPSRRFQLKIPSNVQRIPL